MKRLFFGEMSRYIALLLFTTFTVWWIVIFFLGYKESLHNYIFGALYGIMAMYGGVIGIEASKRWGGIHSLMGKAILFLALGLLAAEFGQIVFSYYNIILHIEIPYPSVADIGFFGNIPLYTTGIFLLAKASGIQITLKKAYGKVSIIIFPLIMLFLSYLFFLQGYEFDWSDPILIFLDFSYPLGQALYVSIALLIYNLSKNVLGGAMRSKILFIVFAFVSQYIADYNFLFQNSRGTWYNAGYGDYLYLIAYFLMTYGLIQLNSVISKLNK